MVDFFLYALLVIVFMFGFVAGNHKKGLGTFFKILFGKYALLFRVSLALALIIVVIGIANYLRFKEDPAALDLARFIIGGLVVVGLFYSILSFEFNVRKTKQDYKTAKEILTFNTANEWHKTPVKDYQKTSIEYEKKFIELKKKRTPEDLYNYVESNLDFRESLKGILNYFENMSIGVYKGLIDKDFIYKFISYIFTIYYIDYYYYIKSHRQKKNDQTIWENFTNLAEDWWPNLKDEVLSGTKKSSLINKLPAI